MKQANVYFSVPNRGAGPKTYKDFASFCVLLRKSELYQKSPS